MLDQQVARSVDMGATREAPPRPTAAPSIDAPATIRTPGTVDDELGVLLRHSVLQRSEQGQEKADSQRSKSRARKTIAALGNNMNAHVNDHLFRGTPENGGAIDVNAPVGIHAYVDGALPAGVVVDSQTGPKSRVHQITWHWAGATGTITPKPSTMFPAWMAPSHVRTLIGLAYADARDTAVTETLYGAEAKQAIFKGAMAEILLTRVSNRTNGVTSTSYFPRWPQ